MRKPPVKLYLVLATLLISVIVFSNSEKNNQSASDKIFQKQTDPKIDVVVSSQDSFGIKSSDMAWSAEFLKDLESYTIDRVKTKVRESNPQSEQLEEYLSNITSESNYVDVNGTKLAIVRYENNLDHSKAVIVHGFSDCMFTKVGCVTEDARSISIVTIGSCADAIKKTFGVSLSN